jgi:hypothetical protein
MDLTLPEKAFGATRPVVSDYYDFIQPAEWEQKKIGIVVADVNQRIARDIEDLNLFITLFYSEIDISNIIDQIKG